VHIFRRRSRGVAPILLTLDDAQDAGPVEVAGLGLHPALADVDGAGLEDVGGAGAAGDIALDGLGEELEDGGGEARALQVDARGGEAAGDGIDVAVDHIGGEDVGAVGIGVAEKVCEGDGGEGVAVGEGGFVEFYHCGDGWRCLRTRTSCTLTLVDQSIQRRTEDEQYFRL